MTLAIIMIIIMTMIIIVLNSTDSLNVLRRVRVANQCVIDGSLCYEWGRPLFAQLLLDNRKGVLFVFVVVWNKNVVKNGSFRSVTEDGGGTYAGGEILGYLSSRRNPQG
jgi:hypothetical protein